MFFDSWGDVVRVLLVGALAYASLVALLRVSGKRTLAKLNAFDLVVTVALGSTLATIALSADVSALEGAAALLVLVGAQLVVARMAVRWQAVRRVVSAGPTCVLRAGRFDGSAMHRERLTEAEVRQAVRARGLGDLSRVGAVVLESDGSLNVIPSDALGDASALVGVGGVDTA